MAQYIDFAYVKDHADFSSVLQHYQVALSGAGVEKRGRCPFHDDTDPSFSVNIDKKVFQCHAASCGLKGNILDFVVAMEPELDLRAAAETLAEICAIDLAPPKGPARGRGKGRGRSKTGRAKVPQKPAAKESSSATPGDAPEHEPEPISFELPLDPDHPYGTSRGLSPTVIRRFGMGYYGGKGMMRGRWCVPIRNAEGEVVGYIGRWATDPVPDGTAKYLLPPRFNKNGVLFNLDRIPLEVEHVVVVEGVFDAIRLDTLCVPTVAVLGTSVSDWHQHELATRFKTATVLWDGIPSGMPDADSLVAQDRAIAKLAEAMPTRSHRLSPGVDPASASRQVLLELVGSLRWRP